MELEAALRRQLLSLPVVTGYVQDRVWKFRLEDDIDGTGQRAIVVSRAGGWASPLPRNTQEFPVARIQFWADHTRNPDGTIATEDGQTSAWAMYRATDPLFHGVRDVRWGADGDGEGGMFVIGCSRWSEPREDSVAALATGRPGSTDSDRLEAACVVVDYAVQVIH